MAKGWKKCILLMVTTLSLIRVGFLLLTIYLFGELGNWGIGEAREYFLVS
ncbi:MAG: hypothetical protein AB4368_04360 [Xenococcaceae cyanobacterium]